MTDHMRAQWLRVWHWSNELAPNFSWEIGNGDEGKEPEERNGGDDTEEAIGEENGPQDPDTGAPILPHITRIPRIRTSEEGHIELDPLPSTNADR